jgi:hypothetical protein
MGVAHQAFAYDRIQWAYHLDEVAASFSSFARPPEQIEPPVVPEHDIDWSELNRIASGG